MDGFFVIITGPKEGKCRLSGRVVCCTRKNNTLRIGSSCTVAVSEALRVAHKDLTMLQLTTVVNNTYKGDGMSLARAYSPNIERPRLYGTGICSFCLNFSKITRFSR